MSEYKKITLILERCAFANFSAEDRCSTRDWIYKNKARIYGKQSLNGYVHAKLNYLLQKFARFQRINETG